MAEWLVFAWRELGRVEARTRDDAMVLAARQFGDQVDRVQSRASYEVERREGRHASRRMAAS